MVEVEPALEQKKSLMALYDGGRYQEAEAQAHALLGTFPLSGFVWMLLGISLDAQGKPPLTALQRAVRLLPDSAEARYNLANAEQRLGHAEKAIENYRLAIQLNPSFSLAHHNLGAVLQRIGQSEQAIAAFQRALELQPHAIETLNNLGAAYLDLRQLHLAMDCYRASLAENPGDPEANLMLATVYMDLKQYVDAEELCRRALEVNPDFAEMRENRSRILAYLSDFNEVVAESDRAFALKSDHSVMWEQRLYSFSYHPDLSAEAIFKEFERWGDRFPDPVVDFSAHDRDPHRRIRIGYVSPDFRKHTSRFYFWPLFSNHDRNAFELFAYSNVEKEVAWTRLFQGQFEHWRDIRPMSDEAAAQLIRDDKIDILVDLCSHMKDERLGVFTRKPAPIQATWLGAAWTTGLKMIDYVLLDPYLAPEGTLARETILPLPHTFLCFRPPEDTADLVPAPCLKNGFVTFGYSGRTERLNHRTFRVWGEILGRIPEARLILDFGPFADPKTQAYYRTFLASHGVDVSRVTLRRSTNIFEGLNDIDILLDSFPHSGGTMLMDAFWMGVPAIALASRPPLGRICVSMLTNLGLPEWIATTEGEYIDKACAFAGQPQLLNDLRLGMRDRMQQSPLMDGPGFARGVEDAYRIMFHRWLQEVSPE
jgi:predicted O-linked N-acetylglucosamine transferase (SPINDLY family)